MIRRFVESCKEGQKSRMMTMGKNFHASRLDPDHIFGVVDLDHEQSKKLDAISEVTLLPMFNTKPIEQSKNPSGEFLANHLIALAAHGITAEYTTDQAVEAIFEIFGNPALLR